VFAQELPLDEQAVGELAASKASAAVAAPGQVSRSRVSLAGTVLNRTAKMALAWASGRGSSTPHARLSALRTAP